MEKLEDLLIDDSFINFVNRSNPEDVQKWEQFILDNPDSEEVIQRSAIVIRSLCFNREASSEAELESGWSKLNERIKREMFINPVDSSKSRQRSLMKMIAVFSGLFVLLGSLAYYHINNQKQLFETGIAHKASLTLPDGSEVSLNKNSSLSFNKDWGTDEVRKVWLKGEAYFSISKKKLDDGQDQKFMVYTDDLIISVVGTSFNVNTFDKDVVVLETGVVTLRMKGDRAEEELLLLPGQIAQVNEEGRIEAKEAEFKDHLAWKDETLTFDNNSIAEIITSIESRYGIKVEYDDPEFLKRRLSGQIRVNNLTDLLKVLEKTFEIEINKQDDAIKMITK